MEQNVIVISKKIWKIVRVAIFMIRKGLCKKKILMDLNMMMKRGKIAGKALGNLMFHNHHHHHNIHHLFTQRGGVDELPYNPTKDAREYEFSCSNTPLYQHYFTNKRKNHQKKAHFYMPSPLPLEGIENINLEGVNNMLEMMLRGGEGTNNGVWAASPGFTGLGFWWSPAARQLRITDSPFPVHNVEGDKHVDQAAEDFIKNFYSQLKQQN